MGLTRLHAVQVNSLHPGAISQMKQAGAFQESNFEEEELPKSNLPAKTQKLSPKSWEDPEALEVYDLTSEAKWWCVCSLHSPICCMPHSRLAYCVSFPLSGIQASAHLHLLCVHIALLFCCHWLLNWPIRHNLAPESVKYKFAHSDNLHFASLLHP